MTMQPINTIALAGSGWGALSAFLPLTKLFPSVDVITTDSDLLSRLRAADKHLPDIAESNADLVICAGYKSVISVEAVKQRPHLNVHYSLLPKYRGMHSTVWAILNGEEVCGCTVHLMNEFIDDGPIAAQFSTPTEDKTSRQIMEECNQWVRENLDTIVANFIKNPSDLKVQDKSQATWVPRRNLDDCMIDFNSTSAAMQRTLRALVDPYPRPRFQFEETTFDILKAHVLHRPYFCTNGRVVNIDREGLWIKISDGLLVVEQLAHNQTLIPLKTFKIGARLTGHT